MVLAGLAFPAHRLLPSASLPLRFLTGVLTVALRTGLEPAGLVAGCGQLDGGPIDLARSLCDQAAVALDRTRSHSPADPAEGAGAGTAG